jgi:hypothetical protein
VFGQLVKHGPLGTIQNGGEGGGGGSIRERQRTALYVHVQPLPPPPLKPSSDRQVGISMHIELFN